MSSKSCIPCVVFGASGYTGVELARLITEHPLFSLHSLFVSENSNDAHKSLSTLYPKYFGLIDKTLLPALPENIDALLTELTQAPLAYIFLATPHEFSHDIAASLIKGNIKVIDLSGGFRLKQIEQYPQYYGFEHQFTELLAQTPYGLPEWNSNALQDCALISLPGCYPTASQLAIKPLIKHQLLADNCVPIINAVSGVSGAGRKANLATSYCELSLKPYNLFSHRHTPEITQEVGRKVIFTPHVADFERGILATITLQLKNSINVEQVSHAFTECYANQALVRLRNTPPTIKDVANTPFCDLYWQVNGSDLIVISAIDNLLKGAASQAIQCANLISGQNSELGLIPTAEVI